MVNTTERTVRIAGDITEFMNTLEKMKATAEDMVKAVSLIGDEYQEMGEDGKESLSALSKAQKDIMRQQALDAETLTGKIKKIFAETNMEYSKIVAEMQKEGGAIGIVGAALPAQLGGIQAGVGKLKGSILSELPFGGLAGLMMYGAFREEEIRALGAGVMRQFQQSSQVASGSLAAINEEARELGKKLGVGQEGMFGTFQASAAQFAQTGIDVESVLKNKFQSPIEGVKESAIMTAVRLDTMFEVAAGTSARNMATVMGNFNLDLSESAKTIAGIGLAARDSGSSVQAFMESVIRSATAMRTMRVDISEATDAQIKFARVAKEQLGLEGVAAARYSEIAMSQVTRGISGLSVGMSAVLAERISAGATPEERERGFKPVTGLDAYYAFKEGFDGAGQKEGEGIFVKSIEELLKMAKETGGGASEQRRFLEVQGMGIEGSRVLMSISKDMEAGNSIQEAVANHQKELNATFSDAESKTSQFQQALLGMQDVIAKLGAGLLGEVVAGFKIVGGIAMKMFGDEAAGKKLLAEGMAQSDAAMQYMIDATKEIPGDLKDALGPIIGVGAGFGPARTTAGTTENIGRFLGDKDELLKLAVGGHGAAAINKTLDMLSKSFGNDIEDPLAPQKYFLLETTKRIDAALKSQDVKPEIIDKLKQAYGEAEFKTGKGEVAFATEARKLLGQRGEQLSGTAERAEQQIASDMFFRTKKGSFRLKVYLTDDTGGLSGQVEGR